MKDVIIFSEPIVVLGNETLDEKGLIAAIEYLHKKASPFTPTTLLIHGSIVDGKFMANKITTSE